MDNSCIDFLRSCNPSKTKEKIQDQLDAWMGDENTCHYFAIQISGQESYPFGKLNRPFYELEKAVRKLEDLKAKHPDTDFYIGYGGFATDFLNFENDDISMHEKIWLNLHEWRLAKLKVSKMNLDQLLEIQPNYFELRKWQEDNNSIDYCHYYFAKTIKEDGVIGMSSQCFFDLKDAIAAKIHFSKIMPEREFQLFHSLLATELMMALDGNTEDTYQILINKHKSRLETLLKEQNNG